jgi:hypothetical protein
LTAGHRGLDAQPAALPLDQRDLGVTVDISNHFVNSSRDEKSRASANAMNT